MRVHHLNCGTFCPLGALMINGHGSPLERGRLVCHCLLLEEPDGLILVDTGIGTRDVAHPDRRIPGPIWRLANGPVLDKAETAFSQIQALGFDPRDVRQIVLTHLDFDHAGGLQDFPEAEVHVFSEEYDEAMNGDRPRDHMRYSQEQLEGVRFTQHRVEGDAWYGFESVRALSNGTADTLLIPLRGHTRGHCGVAIRTSQGWLLHAGDALFDMHELDPDHRHAPPGLRIYENVFQFDREERMNNLERLRELSQTHGSEVRVLCSHDPDAFDADKANSPENF